MRRRCTLLTLVVVVSFWALCGLTPAAAWDNGLALTPPMGWNSWNHFGCNINCTESPNNCISARLLTEMADAMVASGMKAVGYEFINVDDCWLDSTRAPDGTLRADPERFPNGIKPVADYIHSRGLKFGIYEDLGKLTCMGYPGSLGHEAKDVATFAEWGVDLLKLDGCYLPVNEMEAYTTKWSRLLGAATRPIVFSCSWPAYADLDNITVPWAKVASVCNLWREYVDIRDNWDAITRIVDYQESMQLARWAGPGAWNDPDILEVGNGGMTNVEYRAHFSLWAMLAAPLIAGNDLRAMSPQTRAILTAREVIAVDQDPLGRQGRRVWARDGLEVWRRELHDRALAVVLWNRQARAANISVLWTELGLSPQAPQRVRDLWAERDLGTFVGSYSATVAPHGVVMVKLTSS